MADERSSVTVFVDDAVQGHFPRVCARTGQASDGWLTINEDVARGSSLSTWVFVLLLLAGPVGWIAAIVFSGPGPSDILTVQVPWTTSVQARIVALRRRRRIAWLVAAAGAAALVASIAVPSEPLADAGMTGQVLLVTLLSATAAAVISVLADNWRIGRETVKVGLDASRRWVTLGNVHPAFAAAVRRDQQQRRQPQA
jgi:hypothetical protein